MEFRSVSSLNENKNKEICHWKQKPGTFPSCHWCWFILLSIFANSSMTAFALSSWKQAVAMHQSTTRDSVTSKDRTYFTVWHSHSGLMLGGLGTEGRPQEFPYPWARDLDTYTITETSECFQAAYKVLWERVTASIASPGSHLLSLSDPTTIIYVCSCLVVVFTQWHLRLEHISCLPSDWALSKAGTVGQCSYQQAWFLTQ